MLCTCAEHWSTTRIARDKGLLWRNVSPEDGPLIRQFLDDGGTGNPSIDRFAREQMVAYSGQRYANTSLLLNADNRILGFVSNSMGAIKIKDSELMGLNLDVIPHQIPALWLHRLGVHTSHRRKGLGTLLVWRIFETLGHACTHSAGAVVALLVEPGNAEAKGLYRRLFFEPVTSSDKNHELFVLPYDDAQKQIAGLPGN